MVGNSATTFAYEFQRTERRRHEREHETTGMGKKHPGLVAPRLTGFAPRRIKTVKQLKKRKKKSRAGWMPRKHFWLPAQGEVFFA